MERNFKVGNVAQAAAMAAMAVLAMSGVTAAHADTTTTSTATAPATQPRLVDKLALNYFGVYAGPGVGTPGTLTPGNRPEDDSTQNLDSTVTAGYRVTPDVLVGVAINFLTEPVMGKGIKMEDPYLKIGDSKVIHNGGLNLAMDLRTYVTTTEDSKKKNVAGSLRLNENLTYDVGRFTFGSYSYVRAYAFSADVASTATNYKLIEAPYVNYKLNEKVSATVWSDLVQLSHAKGDPALKMTNLPVDIEPGINWDITSNISVNPYLNIYPEHASLRSSSIGMIIVAKAL